MPIGFYVLHGGLEMKNSFIFDKQNHASVFTSNFLWFIMIKDKDYLESIARQTLDRCFDIHRSIGPGLMESVYERTLTAILVKDGFDVKRQLPITFEFEGIVFNDILRPDLLINDLLIVELKSIESFHPIHFKQLLTYLKLSNLPLGILVNFGSAYLKDGIRRVANNY